MHASKMDGSFVGSDMQPNAKVGSLNIRE
jgi:hypothetical protein